MTAEVPTQAGDAAIAGIEALAPIRARIEGERQVSRPLADDLVLDALEALCDTLAAALGYAGETNLRLGQVERVAGQAAVNVEAAQVAAGQAAKAAATAQSRADAAHRVAQEATAKKAKPAAGEGSKEQ